MPQLKSGFRPTLALDMLFEHGSFCRKLGQFKLILGTAILSLCVFTLAYSMRVHVKCVYMMYTFIMIVCACVHTL